MSEMKIALAGNPNSGKTTLFNALTGANQHVGNWPGVTVEQKTGRLKEFKAAEVVDLPGIYSLSPYSPEELVSRSFLIDEKPDVIINLVDATSVERNLYLTMQLLEAGCPVVIAMNMMDEVRKRGDTVDAKALSAALGCPVVEISALKSEGFSKLIAAALQEGRSKNQKPKARTFSKPVEEALAELMPFAKTRWHAVKLLEGDENILPLFPEEVRALAASVAANLEKTAEDNAASVITGETYDYIETLVKTCVKRAEGRTITDRVDAVVLNRVLALPIFAAVMFLVYFISISTIGGIATDWVNDTLFGEIITPGLEDLLSRAEVWDWLSSLLIDGIVAGVGAVLGFLPQMIVLFLCLALLEGCGYMSRIAFILDRIFRRFGLSGKSFISILISTGCGVPGIMSSRTIENVSERRMTIITTTFVPCGAKLPIIALVAGALFPGRLWVAPSAYFLGLAAILVSGLILKHTKPFRGEISPFVMELPNYRMPDWRSAVRTVYDNASAFVRRAATIIMVASVAVWFLSNFTWSLMMTDEADASILASVGRVLAPIFIPLGWGTWQATVATVTGLIAKENIVGTLGVLYGVADGEVNLAAAFTPLAAYSLLVFNLLCAPCVAAMGAVRREMNSGKWTAFALCYQCGFAYAAALLVYQLGSLIGGIA
ncbi:ferrous iron transport protein B [Clostridia bacterium]|nr:ferrous iron transport protein B [Clostridia bacterium]GHV31601.1 ferrous iron transport protein B [Clostridia bacterium]